MNHKKGVVAMGKRERFSAEELCNMYPEKYIAVNHMSGTHNHMEIFDPKIHICKFGFELFDHADSGHVRYNIIGNLYEKEIVFEFIDKKTEEIVDVIGYRISES